MALSETEIFDQGNPNGASVITDDIMDDTHIDKVTEMPITPISIMTPGLDDFSGESSTEEDSNRRRGNRLGFPRRDSNSRLHVRAPSHLRLTRFDKQRSSAFVGLSEEAKLEMFLSDDGIEQLSVYCREFAQR